MAIDLKTNQKKCICIVAGGTGGHVFPAIALAHECEAMDHPYKFITDQRGQTYLRQAGLKDHPVVLPLGSKRQGLFGFVVFIYELTLSFFKSLPVVWHCHTVVGFSGYPTFSSLVAGLILGKPLCIHEQNAILGKVNRVLGRFVKRIFISTQEVVAPDYLKQKMVYTGMPVRSEIEHLQNFAYQRPHDESPIYLLVIGGSQGASVFSHVVPQAIALLPEKLQRRLHVVQQVRDCDREVAHERYAQTHCGAIELKDFIHNMPDLYRQSHLLIARAGASTIAEVEVTGCPALFVPYPLATDDHQTKNAEQVCCSGGAWMIAETDFSSDRLSNFLEDLFLSPKKLLFASQRVKKGYLKNRIKVLVDGVLNV